MTERRGERERERKRERKIETVVRERVDERERDIKQYKGNFVIKIRVFSGLGCHINKFDLSVKLN